MSEPLLVEIIAFAPTAFYHCMHCEVAFREMGKSERVQNEQLASSLPSDLMSDYRLLSDWVRDMLRTHCDRIDISVIDAASVEGVIKSLRYGARRFPSIIIDRRGRFLGQAAMAQATVEINRLLTGAALSPTSA